MSSRSSSGILQKLAARSCRSSMHASCANAIIANANPTTTTTTRSFAAAAAASETAPLVKTALYDLHKELGGDMVPFAGYELPVLYKAPSVNGGVLKEHLWCRSEGKSALFDVSHMGQVRSLVVKAEEEESRTVCDFYIVSELVLNRLFEMDLTPFLPLTPYYCTLPLTPYCTLLRMCVFLADPLARSRSRQVFGTPRGGRHCRFGGRQRLSEFSHE